MTAIDRRIVQMEFDNGRFERNIETSMLSLERLKDSLDMNKAAEGLSNFENVANRFSLEGLSQNVATIAERFTTLGIIGVTALENIANRAIYAGEKLVKSFTITPLKTGFQEYETQINAIQTILANTESKGTTLQNVNDALDELNKYADMTIYNFTQMTRNIGTFTAAGVDLDTSVAAIKGIANLAAVSGSTSQQASVAMYQLSQALAAGTVKLMDWNSVVNAGMGGQVFQDALKETARAHGIAIDQMIKDEGSFRNTLQKGWLSSEILTETLQKFTGDLTEEQLRQMGYTEDQIAGIIKMGETANNAATKVKTFTQLFETLSEAAQSGWAQTWRTLVGDFEEARELLTKLSDIFSETINKSAEARNTMLESWKELGGRTSVIQSVYNLMDAIANIISPISKAFRELFPSTTAEQLFNMTKALEGFTSKLLEFTVNNADRVYSVFHGLFSVVRFGVNVFKELASAAIELASGLMPVGDAVLAVMADLGNLLTNLSNLGSDGDKINAFKYVGEVFSNTLDNIKRAAEGVSPVIRNLGNEIIGVFTALTSSISSAVQSLNLEQILSVISTGLIGLITFENFSGVLSTLDSVRDTLEAWQWTLRADALLSIAAAIGILTVALIGLSSIDGTKLVSSLAALSVLFVELFGAMALFGKNDTTLGSMLAMAEITGSMITVAAAMVIFAQAIKTLSEVSWQDTAKGVAAVSVMLVELTTAMILLSNLNGKMKISATALLGLATSVTILSVAVKSLGEVEVNKLVKGLASVAAILAEVALFQTFTSGNKGMVATAAGLNLVASSMIIFSEAIDKLGTIPIKNIGKGLLAMGVGLAEVAVATKLMPSNMITIGVGLVAVANAMVVLSTALGNMGGMSLEQIGKSFLTLFSSLTVLTTAMIGMQKALPGAAALLTISAALAVFVPVLGTLGNMSVSTIITGLVSLAAAFGVLGAASVLLSPVAPTLVTLAGAIALLGVGVAGIGIGIAGFATALTALAASGVAASTAIVASLTAIISLIPMFITQVGNGIIGLVTVIGESGSAIVTSVSNVLSALITAVATVIPQFVEMGMTLILSFIEAIASNIDQLTNLGIDIVVKFIEAVGSRIGEVVTAGITFAAQFINGVADGISKGVPEIGKAIGNLAWSMVEGLVNGIKNGIKEVVGGVIDMGNDALSALANLLGIHSPSLEFQYLGEYSGAGYARGLTNEIPTITSAITTLSKRALSTLNSYYGDYVAAGSKLFAGTVSGINSQHSNLLTTIRLLSIDSVDTLESFEDEFYDAGSFMALGFAEGIEDYAYVVIRAARRMAQEAYEAAMEELDAASPSKLFKEVGSYVPQGFAIGISSEGSLVKNAATNMADTAIRTTQSAISKIVDYLADGIDTQPVIRPVLDLSNLESGTKTINTMMSQTRALSAASGFNQNGEIIDGTYNPHGAVYQFTQNNYSPKALSRLEIYRQTKNQFSALKGTV